ncbi:hypothetical protein CDD83_5653 [Cordyceps sp. RAO-2017]|nr:hypothetical protein CDD83_5653 [Cordyceps sp. RAO-2017]
MPVPVSKPDPAIYRHALACLGARAAECVAVEDSRSGVLAARGAGLRTVGYTGAYEPAEREALARLLTEAGCELVMGHWSDFGACLERMEKGAGD